ncbi:glycosyltransferase family 1 protein [Pseudomonas syringae]|uniref:Glycosyl transferase family 1 n=1 Tax=Pseudomonas viridiflava ICMP 13104 TaxID=1198305 RepID=A0A0W0HD43_PSEVI|nr:hypothetical protein AO067_21620 [Pseudomonas viridiflava ICMP 13104]
MLGLISRLFKKKTAIQIPLPVMDRKGFEEYKAGHLGRTNILILTENINATYYIGFDIPLGALYNKGLLNFAAASQLRVGKKGAGIWERWDRAFRPDLVIMTRYALPYGREMLDYFKAKNIPVIYHIDDNLLEIPPSLGAVVQQSQGAIEVIQERRYLLENCDIIYASTRYLAEHLQSLYPQQKIFSGIYAPYIASDIAPVAGPAKETKIIGYMGSRGHQQDLELVVPALTRLMNDRSELRFEVFGTIKMPPGLLGFGDRVKSHAVSKGYTVFLSTLSNLKWDIGLAPLVNDKFNLCKAPTKYVEYTAAGIPVVASDILVYSQVVPKGGALLVKDNWYAAINSVLMAPELGDSMLKTSQAFCASAFSEKILQDQLQRLISEALSSRR